MKLNKKSDQNLGDFSRYMLAGSGSSRWSKAVGTGILEGKSVNVCLGSQVKGKTHVCNLCRLGV